MMTKTSKLIIFLLGLFTFFLVVSTIPKNYEYEYQLGKVKIVEKYDSKKDLYSFSFLFNENKYEYALKHKYVKKWGVLDSIDIKNNCLNIKSDKIMDFKVCKINNNYVTSYYNKNIVNEVKDNYKNIKIYDLNDKKFFVWNYRNFIVIEKDSKEEIKLFDKDVYELKIITKIKENLLIADYNQKYQFDKMFMINSKNNRVNEIKLDKKLHFDSYILGTYKKNIYVYDWQQEKEYRINPFKETIEKNSLEVLINNEWEKTSINKLNKKKVYFVEDYDFYYQLIDNKLYYVTPIQKVLVTNLGVSKLIESNDFEAYFIVEDTLYYVNYYKGIKKIMSYTEWKYNNENIYVF